MSRNGPKGGPDRSGPNKPVTAAFGRSKAVAAGQAGRSAAEARAG